MINHNAILMEISHLASEEKRKQKIEHLEHIMKGVESSKKHHDSLVKAFKDVRKLLKGNLTYPGEVFVAIQSIICDALAKAEEK